METRRFEGKKTVVAGLVLFLGLAFLGSGVMLMEGSSFRVIVVFAFLMSLLGILIGLYLLIKADFSLEISREGVRAWVLGRELLPWSAIAAIDPYAPKLGSRTLLTLIELRFVAPRPGAPGIVGDLFPGWAAKQVRDKALLNDLTVKASGPEIIAALEEGLDQYRAAHRAGADLSAPEGTN